MKLFRASLLALSGLALFTATSAFAYTPYQEYQAEESNQYRIPFNVGVDRADMGFQRVLGLGNVLTESLEYKTGESNPPTIQGRSIFDGLATLIQPTGGGMYLDNNLLCYSGSRCITGAAGLGFDKAFGIQFHRPMAGFGFWANDQNTLGDQVKVKVNAVQTSTCSVPETTLGPAATTGQASFFGFIAKNPCEYIISLDIISTNPHAFLVFDQFLTAIPVPGPLPLLGSAVALGFSRKLRRRIREKGHV